MTHDILPSDVECAKAMLESSHSDAEILAFLATRGIEPTKAGGLVDDLRHGRHPVAQLPFGPGRSSPGATARAPVAAGDAPPQSRSPKRRPHRRHRRSRELWWFAVVAIIFLLALGYALFEGWTAATRISIQEGTQDKPSVPGN